MKAYLLQLFLAQFLLVGDVTGFLREVGKAQQNVATVRARFEQEKRVAIVRDTLRSSGRFLLDRAGRVAWEIEEPEPLRLVVTREGVFAGGKPLREGPAALSPLPFLERFTALFAGISEEIERDFIPSLSAPNRLRLEPRSEALGVWVEAIELGFDEERRFPERIRLEESSGDSTEIRFHDVEVNPPLDEAAFRP